MRVTIHQPEHLPRMSYFEKMRQADLYVFLDVVQYRKNYFQNRNHLNGFWLTVPVHQNGHITSTLRDMKIDNSQLWRKKYWGRMEDVFRHEPNFKSLAPQLKAIIDAPHEYLVDLNYALILFFKDLLGIQTPTIKASELGVSGHSSELLADICRATKADVYLSGPSGQQYLDTSLFPAVEFFHYDKPDQLAIEYLMRKQNE